MSDQSTAITQLMLLRNAMKPEVDIITPTLANDLRTKGVEVVKHVADSFSAAQQKDNPAVAALLAIGTDMAKGKVK